MNETLLDDVQIVNSIIDLPIPPLLIDEDRDLGVVSDPQTLPARVSEADPTDVFTFSLDTTQNLNLALTNITAGDDADISLYRDVNGNGVLDIGIDTFIQSSIRSSNSDEAINVQGQEAGTYLAVVERYAEGSFGSVGYDLSLSATPPAPTTSPSNLLPTEVAVGDLSDQGQTFFGSVGNMNTADVYRFSVDDALYGYRFLLDLTGLSADVDVRLIQDSNSNGIVDAGEELVRSQNGGNANESINIRLPLDPGDYFVQVYQYSGESSYQLEMGTFSIVG